MPTVIDVWNAALIEIGADTIMSVDQDNKKARILQARYQMIRDAVLRAHPWNCAQKRTELQLIAKPTFGFGCAYRLPPDCLRVLELEHDQVRFKIEGRALLADTSPARIRYISRIEDPNEWDALLVEAMVARLAAAIAIPIAQNPNMALKLWEIYELKLQDARTPDAQEGTPDDIIADDWVNARI